MLISVHRLSGLRKGAADRAYADSGSAGETGAADGRIRAVGQADGFAEEARSGRDAGLGVSVVTSGGERDRYGWRRTDHGFAVRTRENARGSGRPDTAGCRKTGGRMLSVNSGTDDRATQSSVEDVLVARYAGFAGWLRANDFLVTTSDIAASMEVAERTGQTDHQLLRWSLRAVLCSRAEEWRRFDDLFDAYFLTPNRRMLAETRAGGAGRIERESDAGQRDGSEGVPLSLAGRGGDLAHAD